MPTPDSIMSDMTRRDFLKLSGSGAALLALMQFPLEKLVALEAADASWPLGIEQFVHSVCDQCPSACGVIGRVVDGKLAKLDGNPKHPTNRGKLCALGQAGTQLLYNPDRLRHPLRQSGPKGSGQWQAVRWDEAISTITEHLRHLRQNNSPHLHAVLAGEHETDAGAVLQRFMESFGSPNHFLNLPARPARAANFMMQGTHALSGYDLEQANLIVSFGAPLLEDWQSPMQAQRAYGYLRQERKGPRAKLIQVESRLSMTAAKADQWIPIRPGTEAALALGIAYVLIKEKLYDEHFVEHQTFGFDDSQLSGAHEGQSFKAFVSKHYRPERVAELTGVSVAGILTLAKELARTKPAMVVGGGATSQYSNGTLTEMAVLSLNALLGSIEVPGGVIHQQRVNLMPSPAVRQDETARLGLQNTLEDPALPPVLPLPLNNPETLLESIETGRPYQITSLWIMDENPVFSGFSKDRWQEALKRVPLVVSFSTFMNETSEWADLVLPHPTFMERRELVCAPSASPVPVVGLMQPIVRPLYETRPAAAVVLDIAHRLEGSVAENFPWKTLEAFQDSCIENIFQEKRGTVFTDSFEESHVKLLEARGYWRPKHSSFQEFHKDFKEKGGWWDPHHPMQRWGSVFKTESHRFEFLSQSMAKRLDRLRTGLSGDGGQFVLPHYEPAKLAGDQSEFPLFLMLYRPFSLAASHAANLPWMQEYLVPHLPARWVSWVEVNPETAHRLHLQDRQMAWVESPLGRIKVQVRTYAGSMPGVVSCILGQGHTALGRWAKGRGENPLKLVGSESDPLAGSQALLSARVRLYGA